MAKLNSKKCGKSSFYEEKKFGWIDSENALSHKNCPNSRRKEERDSTGIDYDLARYVGRAPLHIGATAKVLRFNNEITN